MKFGKNLNRIVELSDPEWGPYWINYNFLKRKIKREIVAENHRRQAEELEKLGSVEVKGPTENENEHHHPTLVIIVDCDSSNSTICDKNCSEVVGSLLKSAAEVDFFRVLRMELKKTSEFFASAEQLFRIRHQRVHTAFTMLKNDPSVLERNKRWSRLLSACVRFYKDVLMLENFAIMNYCGFSKILKKHDKATGFATRDAFMCNVMSQQNFAHYPYLLTLIKETERLFKDIQHMDK